MVERLTKATSDERKVHEKTMGADLTSVHSNQLGAQARSASLPVRPKGFYIPKTSNEGIRINRKNGVREVVRPPRVNPVHNEADNSPRKSQAEGEKHDKAASQVAAPSVKSKKVGSVASHTSQQIRHMVRIVGKNGEELFAEMPRMRYGSRQGSHQPERAQNRTAGRKAITPEEPVDNGAKRDADAAKIAKQMREQRLQQDGVKQQRAERAKSAANVIMSGALPAASRVSSHKPAASIRSAKSSARSSGLALGGIFGDTSKPPSVASSKTSLQASQRAGSAQSQPKSSQHPQSSQRDKSSFNGWQEVGAGVFQTAVSVGQKPSRSESRRPSPVASIHSSHREAIMNEERSRQSGQTVRTASHILLRQSLRQSEQWKSNVSISQHSSNAIPTTNHSPTIYAGRGWISPHPLSVAPTEFQETPEQAIRIPSRNGGPGGETTMTFREWRELQGSEEMQTTRRSYSRSTSGAGSHPPGSWGHRNAGEDVSGRSGVSQGVYRSPMAESVRSGNGSAQTYQHPFDGAREVDGQTYLRMPWDDQGDWERRDDTSIQ